jgi:hypothetical protein
LIDLSISHLLPPGVNFICEAVNSMDPKIIAEYEFGGLKATYRIKESVRLPALHRKSLLERAGEAAKTKESIVVLKTLVFVSIGMGAVNFLLNLVSLALRAAQ